MAYVSWCYDVKTENHLHLLLMVVLFFFFKLFPFSLMEASEGCFYHVLTKIKQKNRAIYTSMYRISLDEDTCYMSKIQGTKGMWIFTIVLKVSLKLSWCATSKNDLLTAFNWQKQKGIFLTCPHKVYRVEAAGLKSFNLYFKYYFFSEYVHPVVTP